MSQVSSGVCVCFHTSLGISCVCRLVGPGELESSGPGTSASAR